MGQIRYYKYDGSPESKKELDSKLGKFKIKFFVGRCYFEENGAVYSFIINKCMQKQDRNTLFETNEMHENVEKFILFLHSNGIFNEYTIDDVLGYNRKKEICDLRMSCYYFLRQSGFLYEEIAFFMRRNHSTVVQTLKPFLAITQVKYLIILTDEYIKNTYKLG